MLPPVQFCASGNHEKIKTDEPQHIIYAMSRMDMGKDVRRLGRRVKTTMLYAPLDQVAVTTMGG